MENSQMENGKRGEIIENIQIENGKGDGITTSHKGEFNVYLRDLKHLKRKCNQA